jgi:polyhydroxyalkanoate synthesis regulator phasin
LTLLGEVKQCQEKYESSPRFGNEGYFSYGNISDCKMKMQKLFDEMLKYMEDNNDKQNKFIKMLCDDIHISQKTLGTRYGRMCISSRQTSQGTQRIYTVNTTPIDRRRQDFDSDSDSDDCQKAAPRQRSPGPSSNFTIDTDDYEVSNDCMEDSPYLTQTAKTVMRSISYVSSSDSEKSEEEEKEKSAIEEADDDLTISP